MWWGVVGHTGVMMEAHGPSFSRQLHLQVLQVRHGANQLWGQRSLDALSVIVLYPSFMYCGYEPWYHTSSEHHLRPGEGIGAALWGKERV